MECPAPKRCSKYTTPIDGTNLKISYFKNKKIYFSLGGDSSTQLWITTISLIIHLLLFNLGYGCLGFPVLAEILPESFRSKGLALITFSAGIFGFLNSKSYLDLKFYFGSGTTFLIYGIINFFGGIFIKFCLPDLQS